MQDFIRDVRIAARGLRRAPGFTGVVVAVLALGIGMATALFAVDYAVLMRPLPVRDQDRIVVLWGGAMGTLPRVPIPYASYVELRNTSRTLSDVAAYGENFGAVVAMHSNATTAPLRHVIVTGNFFTTLGAAPYVGRLIRPSDDVAGAAPVVVLSHAAWRRVFLGETSIIGRRVTFSGYPVSPVVIGVAPPGFALPSDADAWSPIGAFVQNPLADSAGVLVDVVARVAPGMGLSQVRAEFTRVLHDARLGDPELRRKFRGEVHTLPSLILGNVRPGLLALAAVVSLLLLIACANVGNLLLVRGAGRQHELAIRRAIGASFARLVRELLVESALLAICGGVAGTLLALFAIRALPAIAPADLPRLDAIHPGAAPLVVAIAVTIVSTLIFALAPAFWHARADLASPLRASMRGGGARQGTRRGRDLLVGLQLALAIIVLAGAGLVARSLLRLQHLELGYQPEGLAILELDWPWNKYGTEAQTWDPLRRIVSRVEALPGVVAATPVHRPPFAGHGGMDGAFIADGQSENDLTTHAFVNMELCGSDYFKTFGIPLLRGRSFTDADREGTTLRVIVSESAARRYWPGADPVGKRIRLNAAAYRQQWLTVVGVVPDTRYRDYRVASPTIYFPYRQGPAYAIRLAVRTVGEPDAMASTIRSAIATAEPAVGVLKFESMDQLLGAPLAQPRLDALLLSIFGAAALVLAAIGMYAITATAVRQQMREIGVRVALGATPNDISRLVLGGAGRILVPGVAAGLLGAFMATRALRSMLFEVSPGDPVALFGASLFLVFVALIAASIPAHRASRIDPAKILRAE